MSVSECVCGRAACACAVVSVIAVPCVCAGVDACASLCVAITAAVSAVFSVIALWVAVSVSAVESSENGKARRVRGFVTAGVCICACVCVCASELAINAGCFRSVVGCAAANTDAEAETDTGALVCACVGACVCVCVCACVLIVDHGANAVPGREIDIDSGCRNTMHHNQNNEDNETQN